MVDRRWNLLRANAGAARLTKFLTEAAPANPASSRPVNLADALVSPDDLRQFIVNWEEVALHFLRGVQADAPADGMPETAALFQRVNPKGWVSALGALAAYTTVGGDLLRETSVIAAVLDAAVFLSVAIWAGFGAALGRLLGNRQARRAFNGSMAGLLALSLLPVFW